MKLARLYRPPRAATRRELSALASAGSGWHRPRVNSLRSFLLLAVLVLSSGCVTPLGRSTFPDHYRKVTVTDFRSALVAEWIAEGNVRRHGAVYTFRAVQRTTAPPFVTTSHYPQGRRVTVDGPHITIAPCGKPRWLYELDGF